MAMDVAGMMDEHQSVCAVVVAFFPDQKFELHLRTLLPQVGMVVVVDNTPNESCSPKINEIFKNEARLHMIENRANRGISAALNQGLEYAIKHGHKWLLTLDQDTRCYPDMVSTFLHVHEACEPKPAVVGGNYFDPNNDRSKVAAGEAGDFLEQKTVITSGSLIDAAVASSIGGFREDFFIDQVDHEFCLRIRKHGYRVVISRKPVMDHSVGNPGGVRIPFLGVMPNHPPLRKYYIARNSIVTISEYWYQEPGWCLRRLARLVLGLLFMATLEDQRLAKVRAFAAGVRDGVGSHMGAYSSDKF